MIRCRAVSCGCALFAWFAFGAAFALRAQEEPEGGAPEAEAKTEVEKKLTPEEQYIRENLEKLFSPTKVEFLDDGRVHLIFNFGEKKEEHMPIFTPPISENIRSTFRWALDGEFTVGTWGRARDPEVSGYRCEGIRIGNSGAAHLNLWFEDDVEAEIAYIQSVTSTPRQTIAVVYTNPKGQSIGANFGSQCAFFSAGALTKQTGSFESVRNETETRIKVVVKDGSFTAYRDNKKRDTAKYPEKNFASGRVGIIWGGGVASFIHRLEITGKIDAKKMAEEMKKGAKKKPAAKK